MDDALKQFDAAAALDPAFADVHVLKGLALEAANRQADAAGAYRAAWQRQPDNMAQAYRSLRSAGRNASPVAEVVKALSSEVERGSTPGDKPVTFVDARLLDEASIGAPIFVPTAFNDALGLLVQGEIPGYDCRVESVRARASRHSAR